MVNVVIKTYLIFDSISNKPSIVLSTIKHFLLLLLLLFDNVMICFHLLITVDKSPKSHNKWEDNDWTLQAIHFVENFIGHIYYLNL